MKCKSVMQYEDKPDEVKSQERIEKERYENLRTRRYDEEKQREKVEQALKERRERKLKDIKKQYDMELSNWSCTLFDKYGNKSCSQSDINRRNKILQDRDNALRSAGSD
jgi:hypothetical protein